MSKCVLKLLDLGFLVKIILFYFTVFVLCQVLFSFEDTNQK